jgi:hypothetical protein
MPKVVASSSLFPPDRHRAGMLLPAIEIFCEPDIVTDRCNFVNATSAQVGGIPESFDEIGVWIVRSL